MPRVIISTGHSSSNPGTIANGLREVDVIRQIAKATLPHLRANGIISLSVPPDLDVSQRIEWINKSGYAEENNDVCIELHLNSGGDSGLEGWYEDEGQNKSEALAEDILQKTAEETGLKNNGAHSEYDHEYGSLAFLHETLPVAALIECGFIDNNDDAEFLKKPENIEKVGRGIAKGILKYFGIEFKDSLPAGSNTIQHHPLQQV
ncbi:MAG: Sporulation-specific N-acetylmuramoyl-L-alanine amidase [candidate division WS6 bacterium OLB21]|uniref:Sporulation-specific N-acetylmuramoyl-L-alanine amidase n=1 Tax=candidate division WS6 bacterium OLB21 TaxID=1617427 RepID=A0A136KFZ7_9BACT|nr:MAG: Sporulation-specific N-acetylmuramoyl-L-alanine amidase [candidate division WS6 bacterium OLB21]